MPVPSPAPFKEAHASHTISHVRMHQGRKYQVRNTRSGTAAVLATTPTTTQEGPRGRAPRQQRQRGQGWARGSSAAHTARRAHHAVGARGDGEGATVLESTGALGAVELPAPTNRQGPTTRPQDTHIGCLVTERRGFVSLQAKSFPAPRAKQYGGHWGVREKIRNAISSLSSLEILSTMV